MLRCKATKSSPNILARNFDLKSTIKTQLKSSWICLADAPRVSATGRFDGIRIIALRIARALMILLARRRFRSLEQLLPLEPDEQRVDRD